MNLKITLPHQLLIICFLLFLSKLTASAQQSCPPSMEVCINKSPFSLDGSEPSGGTYSGPGVMNGIFTPTAAGAGNHSITYQNSQQQTCTFSISVYESIPITCLLDPNSFCINGNPMMISSCILPTINGSTVTFSGTGIIDNLFHPAVAGLGQHAFSMTATDVDGCSGTQMGNVFVYNGVPPTVTCPSNITVAGTSASPFQLTGGTSSAPEPAQTYYSGAGVLNDVFTPSFAGNGSHTVTFNANVVHNGAFEMCWSSCTFNISVGTLPVTLTKFNANVREKNIVIDWETESESKFDRFELQKSITPKTEFIKFQEVPGSGFGNKYSFIDSKSETGVPVYYRLKMIDKDGSFAYSKIVWALLNGTANLHIYPNPAERYFNIESPSAIAELKLTSPSGTTVYSERAGFIKSKKVSLPSLPAGMYLLEVQEVNGLRSFSKLLIE